MEKILILVPLVLLFSLMQTADSMTIRFNFTLKETIENIPLDMADDSVDDMYLGCEKKMEKKVKTKYLKKEKKLTEFKKAWDEAEKCVKDRKKKNNNGLTKYQMRAICAYTDSFGEFYSIFNKAVREGGSKYGSSFAFHTVHYFLTSAVQTLNNEYKCQITYRRTNDTFIGHVNQIIRFGFFASSSFDKKLDFGRTTCFQIKTCSGAFLGDYSKIPEEQEVLIPPYEVFKITEKFSQGTFKDLKDCKVVYVLESLGIMSKLNCRAVFP